jgi:hypothetical protein
MAAVASALLLRSQAGHPLLQQLLEEPVAAGEGLAQRLLALATAGTSAGGGGSALAWAVPAAADVAAWASGRLTPSIIIISSSKSSGSSSREVGSGWVGDGCSIPQLLERVRLVQECLLLLRALLSSTPPLGESLHVPVTVTPVSLLA